MKDNENDKVFKDSDYSENYIKWWLQEYPKGICLPLHIYEHSGVALKAGEPITEAEVTHADGYNLAKKDAYVSEEIVVKNLKAEIETLEQYINGSIWGFTNTEGKSIDSCGGFYGDSLEEAIETMDLPSDVHIVREAKATWS